MMTADRKQTCLFIRTPVFDVIKFAMMVWVIWGHLGLYGICAGSDEIPRWILNMKIGVNMPIFFVISGYLAFSSFTKGSWLKIGLRTIGMIWPQFIFATFCSVLYLVILHRGGAFGMVMNFWFLHTIAIIYFLCATVYRISRTDVQRWAVFAVVYILMIFWPSRLQCSWTGQVIHMYPYFVFGLMVLRKRELWRLDWISTVCGAVFLIAVFLQGTSAECYSSTNGMNFWTVNPYWRSILFDAHNLFTFIARTVVGISGSVALLWLVEKLCKLLPQLNSFAIFGTTSMGVYVIHEFVIMLAGRHPPFPFPSWSRLPVAFGYFLLCHLIIIVIKRFKLLNCAFFGVEKLVYSSGK